MQKIPINKIKVSEERARKTFENVDKLACSIQDYGLLEPLILDKDYNLIAGERRLLACKMLDLKELVAFETETRIYCFHFLEGEVLDEWHKKAMELEENLQRENLTFAEECEAKLRLHELYQEKHGKTVERKKGGWGVDESAELLGDSVGETVQDLALARAIRVNPKLAEKETKSAAYKAMRAGDELELRKKIAQILAAETPKEERIKIVLGDSRLILKQYDDEFFDFCVTDPPYGVGIDESHDLGKVWDVRVSDTKGEFGMQTEVFKEVYRVLRQGAHCYVFFASMRYVETMEMLKEVGLWHSPIPIIWVKTGVPPLDPYHMYKMMYEPIFYCTKGKPRSFTGRLLPDNVFTTATPSSKVHPTEKPIELIKFLIGNCSVEGEIGIDPFAGSGTFGVACSQLNRRCVMVECDEGYYTECWRRVEMEGGRDATIQTIETSEGSVKGESEVP